MLAGNAARAIAIGALAMVASGASALEFHGYFRDSLGFNSFGGGQACFQLPGSDFKARLGNECDRYLEAALAETGKVTGAEWRVEFMAASGMPTTGAAANTFFLQQMWASLEVESWGGVTLWGGRRFYRRHDVHGIDWFYWNPAQGSVAVGIEDVPVGAGKAALTLIRMDATPAGTTGDFVRGTYAVPDLRVYDLPVNPDGTLEIGVDLALAYDQNRTLGAGRAAVSPLFTLQHNQTRILGGSNTLAFQYGLGAFAHGSGNGPDQLLAGGTTGDRQWRVIEHLVVNPAPEVSGAIALVYQDKSAPGPTRKGSRTFSAEIRPAYQPCDHFKLAADVFYQTISFKDPGPLDGTPTLVKLTAAPTFVLGRGYYARPELRFFATHAAWNDAAARAGTIGNGAFPTDRRSGWSFGASMELWF